MTVQNKVFIVYYVNTDEPECSEIVDIYTCKNRAIKKLIEIAGYRNDNNGKLTQYFRPTSDYKSYNDLYTSVEKNMELFDEDIYRIHETSII